jgi:anti-sigma factor RsiW
MKCRQAERYLLRSLDQTPNPDERLELDRHLRACPRCRVLAEDYTALRDGLRGLPQGSPKPYFWERLNARLEGLEKPEPAAVWRTWCLRAIPVSLFLIGLFIGGLIFMPGGDDNLNQSEALLLRNTKPLIGTNAYLEEAQGLDKNLVIIFAASERNPERKPRP